MKWKGNEIIKRMKYQDKIKELIKNIKNLKKIKGLRTVSIPLSIVIEIIKEKNDKGSYFYLDSFTNKTIGYYLKIIEKKETFEEQINRLKEIDNLLMNILLN